MSYCRFSSDIRKSDVYVYESDYGWVTHVAQNRVQTDEALPPEVMLCQENAEAFFYRMKKVSEILARGKRVGIGLPWDGATFTDPTPKKCADRLIKLKNLGYHVPQHAVDALLEEWEEMKEG